VTLTFDLQLWGQLKVAEDLTQNHPVFRFCLYDTWEQSYCSLKFFPKRPEKTRKNIAMVGNPKGLFVFADFLYFILVWMRSIENTVICDCTAVNAARVPLPPRFKYSAANQKASAQQPIKNHWPYPLNISREKGETIYSCGVWEDSRRRKNGVWRRRCCLGFSMDVILPWLRLS